MSNGEAMLPDLVIEFIDAVAVHPETEYIEPDDLACHIPKPSQTLLRRGGFPRALDRPTLVSVQAERYRSGVSPVGIAGKRKSGTE